MIENINYEDYNDYTACKKINEIIDFLNDKFDFGDDEYQSTRQRHNIIDYMQADMKEFKSWQKKLEEAEVNLKEYIEYIEGKGIYDVNIKIIIKKYKQVISELIKDNEEKEDTIGIISKEHNSLEKQLQQKQIDEDIIHTIESIKLNINKHGCYEPINKFVIVNDLDKLLKYFKEIK